MAKYNELIYMCMDELKLISDDSFFEESHIQFLLTKYRALLLKQRYADIRKDIPISNKQTIEFSLEKITSLTEGVFMKSTNKVPSILNIGGTDSFSKINLSLRNGYIITFVSQERFPFTNSTKYLQNIIYCTIDSDNYLRLKSANPQVLYLDTVQLTSVFENPEEVFNLTEECNIRESEFPINIRESEFPIEDSLVITLIQLVVNELANKNFLPEDDKNNARDNNQDINIK